MDQLPFEGEQPISHVVMQVTQEISIDGHASRVDVAKEMIRRRSWPEDWYDGALLKAALKDVDRVWDSARTKSGIPAVLRTESGQGVLIEWADASEWKHAITTRRTGIERDYKMLRKMVKEMCAKFGWAPEIPLLVQEWRQEPGDDQPESAD